ncbi:helix-turn-helix transcriptional regulator [Paenibacillus sp. FSL W7-1287]|uniref:helix-turn-helix transcriptional regulator n=1 Tax=Paenibacillus sp. FSL W7-1287 TaxID=2954538 RepID=UPI0030F80E80
MLENLTLTHTEGSNRSSSIEHSSAEYHFYIITYGSCIFHTSDVTMTAEKGQFVLAPANCSYEERSTQTGLHQKYSFSFTCSQELLQVLPLLQKNNWLILSTGLYDRSIERLRPLWKELQEEQPYAALRIGAYLLDTLVLWQRELDRGELAPASLIHIERMKQYIQSHYRQRITKDVLADYIRRSPSYTASLFKKGTGQTISEYVHAVRMKTAMYMLSASLLSITEISEYLGYADVSYFQRLFKRTFGNPPSHYMQERSGSNS